MKGSMRFSDQEILDGILSNDEEALSSLYKVYYPMILNFIMNNNGTEQEAKDIYQEAVIIFYEKIREGIVLSCKIKTFIYSVCRNQWLKRLHEKSRYAARIDDVEEFIHVEEDVLQGEEKEHDFKKMAESLQSLGEPCKTIIEDFYIKELSMEEIADKFGYTNSDNAKNQKYKCLQRLKKLFFNSNKKPEL
jgi:RNA polymerase sigma factor (sigma-70 family)